jgi:hypothetical protein
VAVVAVHTTPVLVLQVDQVAAVQVAHKLHVLLLQMTVLAVQAQQEAVAVAAVAVQTLTPHLAVVLAVQE